MHYLEKSWSMAIVHFACLWVSFKQVSMNHLMKQSLLQFIVGSELQQRFRQRNSWWSISFIFTCACTQGHSLCPFHNAGTQSIVEEVLVVEQEKLVDIVGVGVWLRPPKIDMSLIHYRIIYSIRQLELPIWNKNQINMTKHIFPIEQFLKQWWLEIKWTLAMDWLCDGFNLYKWINIEY